MWKDAPDADRRFITTLIVINDALGPHRVRRYVPLIPDIEVLLNLCKRETLFSIIAECVGLLTRAPALDRIKAAHRERAVKSTPLPHRAAAGKGSRRRRTRRL